MTAPAKSSSALKMSFESELGAQAPLGFFDPLGLLIDQVGIPLGLHGLKGGGQRGCGVVFSFSFASPGIPFGLVYVPLC